MNTLHTLPLGSNKSTENPGKQRPTLTALPGRAPGTGQQLELPSVQAAFRALAKACREALVPGRPHSDPGPNGRRIPRKTPEKMPLPQPARHVAQLLANHGRTETRWIVWPKQRTLREDSYLSEDALRVCLRQLEACGIIAEVPLPEEAKAKGVKPPRKAWQIRAMLPLYDAARKRSGTPVQEGADTPVQEGEACRRPSPAVCKGSAAATALSKCQEALPDPLAARGVSKKTPLQQGETPLAARGPSLEWNMEGINGEKSACAPTNARGERTERSALPDVLPSALAPMIEKVLRSFNRAHPNLKPLPLPVVPNR